MTHKLSELKIKDCRHHPRGSVRRASGFVLTGNTDVGRSADSYLQTAQGSWPWDAHDQCGHEENHRVFLAKMRLNLGGVGRNGADVCNVVAFFEGWDGVDVQDYAGDGSASFEYELAEIVGDEAYFHALLNIGIRFTSG